MATKLVSLLARRQTLSTVRFTSAALGNGAESQFVFEVEDFDDFRERVLESEQPVVVDFFATWCGPCRMLMPRLEAAVAAKEGSVHMAKVDIDQVGDVALDYGVQSVPTVMAFSNGQKIDTFIGVQPDDQITQFIDNLEEHHGA